MNPWLVAVLISLATFRLTRLVVDDHISRPVVDPIQVFFEKRWLKRHPDEVDGDEWRSSIAFVLQCPWCLGLWVAGIMTCVVDVWFTPVALPVLVALAASGVTGMLATAEHAMSGD